MPTRRVTLFVSSALLLMGVATTTRAQCDSAYVVVWDQSAWGMGAAAAVTATDTLHRRFPLFPPGLDGSGYVRIALVPRAFEAAVHADLVLSMEGEARDEYRVVGAPAGTEVTFRVRASGFFDITFARGSCGGAGCNPVVRFSVDGDATEHLEFYGEAHFSNAFMPFERSMTLVRRAEEPFFLRYRLFSSISHEPAYVGLSARVEFDELPPGVRVESCLEANLPTSNRRATWGSLKAMYR